MRSSQILPAHKGREFRAAAWLEFRRHLLAHSSIFYGHDASISFRAFVLDGFCSFSAWSIFVPKALEPFLCFSIQGQLQISREITRACIGPRSYAFRRRVAAEPALAHRYAQAYRIRRFVGAWLNSRDRGLVRRRFGRVDGLAALAENDDFDRLRTIRLDHIVVAVEQVRNHLSKRARIGCVGSRVEGNCAAVFDLERRRKRRENIGDRVTAGGDANRPRAAFNMHFGASDRCKATYQYNRQRENVSMLMNARAPNNAGHTRSLDRERPTRWLDRPCRKPAFHVGRSR